MTHPVSSPSSPPVATSHVPTKVTEARTLPPADLRHRCVPKELRQWRDAASSNTGERDIPVGQRRAMKSLLFGLEIGVRGYNIFVLGPPGSGKTNMTLKLIRQRAAEEPKPHDLCYVFNFKEPYRPQSLCVSSGTGAKLRKALRESITGLSKSVFQTLYDTHFLKMASLVTAQARRQVDEIFEKIKAVALSYDLRLEHEDDQFMVMPLVNGETLEPEVYEEMPPEERKAIQDKVASFQHESAPLIKAQRDQEQAVEERLMDLERQAIEGLVDNTFETLEQSFAEEGTAIVAYFQGMKEYLMENYRELIGQPSDEDRQEGASLEPLSGDELPLAYQVNILNAHKDEGAPVIVEKEPTLKHLFGYLEYREDGEGLSTDLTMIRSGSMHKAYGGYLVLQADDLIRAPEVWEALKQALQHREIRIRDLSSAHPDKPHIHGTLRPLEVPLALKIVLIGNHDTYHLLHHEDDNFSRIFKIRAEFEMWIPRDRDHQVEYCQFLERICKEESMLPLEDEALALMVEQSSREIGSKHRLSPSLVSSIDLLCESNFWAQQQNDTKIAVRHIHEALDFREYRLQSMENSFFDGIERGQILIDTDGASIGQINGLLVFVTMDHRFGIPTKITARTYAGKEGVLNIDREASLSGNIHDKGSMILVGLLGGIWAQKHPLSFNASITFEQLYGEIDGDSASCAEFLALLSSLAQVPIAQGIAVTGSINQRGLVQPIGDVNCKIEGMFKLCERRGLTGNQGVIIPEQNVDSLMLHRDVIEAVEQGKFHVWSIQHVEEAIPILMGLPAGTRDELGNWTPGSLFEKVEQRLAQLYHATQPQMVMLPQA